MIVVACAPGSSSHDAALAHFMGVMSKSVEDALHARRALLADLVQARHDPSTALERAGRASRRCVRAFDDALTRLGRTRPPVGAGECAQELRRWLEAHIEACDLLTRASLARDRADFQRAIKCLAEGELHAAGYNRARQQLARRLLQEV